MKATLLAGAFVSFLSVSAFGADLGVPVMRRRLRRPLHLDQLLRRRTSRRRLGAKDLNRHVRALFPPSAVLRPRT